MSGKGVDIGLETERSAVVSRDWLRVNASGVTSPLTSLAQLQGCGGQCMLIWKREGLVGTLSLSVHT